MSHIKSAFEGGATVDGNPLQDSCLENAMDREAWQATVDGAAKSRTRLSNHHSLTQHRSGGLGVKGERMSDQRDKRTSDSSPHLSFPCTDLESAEEMAEGGGKSHIQFPLQVPYTRSRVRPEWKGVDGGGRWCGDREGTEAQMVKNLPAKSSAPGVGRLPGEGDGYAHECLENPWWATVHGVAQSRTRMSD